MTLPIFLLAFAASPLASTRADETSYGAAVTFERGACVFWTGDVGFTADEFQKDLKDRFDRRARVFISHASSVPSRCIEIAVQAARLAGFEQIEVVTRADTGPIAPPRSGS